MKTASATVDVASIGRWARERREEANLTRQDIVGISKALGDEWRFNQRTLARFENGEGKYAFAHMLRVIQLALRTRGTYVSLDAFFEQPKLQRPPKVRRKTRVERALEQARRAA